MEEIPGGSRDGATNRSMEIGRAISSDREELFTDVISIEPAIPQSPPPNSTSLHSRGISESQNLLPNSPKNLFHYSTTKEIRFHGPLGEPRYGGKGIRGGLGELGRETPVWSGVPQTLRSRRKVWWRDVVVDLLGVAVAMPFFALAATLIYVDGERVEGGKKNILEQCIKAAATLFPLCFSVLMGRAMMKLASWKLEKGTSLGLLERLVGSRTVGGTIFTQARLRSVTILSLGLVLLWLLSPLGSQSVLRILSTTTKSIISDSEISYLNSRQASHASTPDFVTWFSSFAAMFSSVLLAPDSSKNSTMDIWGNVRIPLFSSISSIAPDDNGWRQIPQKNYTPVYTSLFGIPISNLPLGNTTFNIESSYMEFICSDINSTTVRGPNFFTNPGLISTTGPFNSSQNVSDTTTWAMGYVGEDITSLLPNISIQSLDSLPSDTALKTYLPGLFLYQDFTGTRNVTSIYCVPSQAYIESTIKCEKSSNNAATPPTCAVTAQRSSLLPHMPSTLTSFSLLQTFLSLTSLLPSTTPSANNIDLLQNYLINPFSNTYIQSTPIVSRSPSPLNGTGESRLLDQVSLRDFGYRLGQIVNTFLQGSTTNSPAFLKHDAEPKATFVTANESAVLSAQISAIPSTLAVPSTVTTQQDVFRTNWTFLSLFLLSILAMFLAAVSAAVMARKMLARDYLGYVSSLCRESPHVEFPDGGAAMDGFERGRGCEDIRVRLGDVGDVEGGCEVGTGVAVRVGRLGLGREDGVEGLDRRKLYL